MRCPDRTLLLDASSPQVQVGIVEEGRWLSHFQSEEEALNSVFKGVRACLDQTGLDLADLRGFLFCEGPGSILGIRITAMAFNGWRSLPSHQSIPLFRYQSLEAAARLLIDDGVTPPFALLSDFRKDMWNYLQVAEKGSFSTLQLISREEATQFSHRLFHIRQRNLWLDPPENATSIPYSLNHFPQILAQQNLLQEIHSAEAYMPHDTEYKRWKPQRHR